jgi:hypothetical protein
MRGQNAASGLGNSRPLSAEAGNSFKKPALQQVVAPLAACAGVCFAARQVSGEFAALVVAE